MGGGSFMAPVQVVPDFLEGTLSSGAGGGRPGQEGGGGGVKSKGGSICMRAWDSVRMCDGGGG